MTAESPRSGPQRTRDTRARLSESRRDVWVASASADGVAHLVPLSLAWDGERVILALSGSSVTARNIVAAHRARLALSETRDVIMMDTALAEVHKVAEAPEDVGAAYAELADWDPRNSGGDLVYLVLRPTRIQAWREENELPGRTIMRAGAWLF